VSQQNIYNIVLEIRGKQKSHELIQTGEKRRKIKKKTKYNKNIITFTPFITVRVNIPNLFFFV
jgi:hypothetical protein